MFVIRIESDVGGGLIWARPTKSEAKGELKSDETRKVQFHFPSEKEALITAVKRSIRLVMPTHPNGFRNLKTLIDVFGNVDFVKGLIEDSINYSKNDASMLTNWKDLLTRVGCVHLLAWIDEMIEAAIASLMLKVDDLDKEIIERSVQLFSTPKKATKSGRDEILTDVHFTPEISSIVANALGVKYDLFQMMTSDELEVSVQEVRIHNSLIKVMEKYGFKGDGVSINRVTTLISGKKALVRELQILQIQELTGLANEAISQNFNQKTIGKLAAWIAKHILQTSTLERKEIDCRRLDEIRKGCKWTLDPWQKQMIDYIKMGQSVLVQTPTSAGKTFASMSALEWIFNTSNKTVAYIAPKVDLALQTYNNIKATFPTRHVALVTGRISDIPADAQIWVGTPVEMWVYFSTFIDTKKRIKEKKKFSIIIFDEIHTLSTSFGTGIEAIYRAEAIGNLLSLVSEQLIGLSATIHDEDIPILKSFISEQSGITDIKEIMHPMRPVPQESFMWNGVSYISDMKDFVEAPVTPKATFTFLRQLISFQRLRNKTLESYPQVPVLIFESSPRECYDNFVEYIAWAKKEDARIYQNWYKAQSYINAKIEKTNAELRTAYDTLTEAMAANASSKTAFKSRGEKPHTPTRGSALDRVAGSIRPAANTRQNTIITVQHDLKKEIEESLKNEVPNEYTITPPQNAQLLYKRIFDESLPGKVSVQTVDLLAELEIWYTMKPPTDDLESISVLPRVCNGVGPFFRIGEGSSEINNIRAMFNPNLVLNGQRLRNEFINLCEAERIKEEEIRPLFELICDGLEYGIGIILPTMPFVVHYNMLKLLSSKKLKAIFTSHDMSMGINYPIRTVCIRSNKPISVNVAEYMQMAGRSGRRKLDDIGYVIAWNIENAATAEQKNLPRVFLPTTGENQGSQIRDPLAIAKEIELGRYYSVGSEGTDAKSTDLTLALANLSFTGMKHQKSTSSSPINKNETEEEKKKRREEDKKKKRQKKRQDRRREEAEEDGEDFEEEEVYNLRETKSDMGIDEVALASAVAGCISPLAAAMGLSDEDLIEIAERVQRIAQGQITDEMRVNAYEWAQKIALVKSALQELHTRLHQCSNTDWLAYITSVFELLHRVQLRQMRL